MLNIRNKVTNLYCSESDGEILKEYKHFSKIYGKNLINRKKAVEMQSLCKFRIKQNIKIIKHA
jgi:hypothetical protein